MHSADRPKWKEKDWELSANTVSYSWWKAQFWLKAPSHLFTMIYRHYADIYISQVGVALFPLFNLWMVTFGEDVGFPSSSFEVGLLYSYRSEAIQIPHNPFIHWLKIYFQPGIETALLSIVRVYFIFFPSRLVYKSPAFNFANILFTLQGITNIHYLLFCMNGFIVVLIFSFTFYRP